MATTLRDLRGSMTTDSPLAPLLAKGYTPNFDPDAWHVMQERDNALIRDDILHGYASKTFVYEFEIQGKKVRGVSVIGARELATQYKGIKHRMLATTEKRGSLFVFRSFDPLNITTQVLPELADEDDYYECIVEISDIKTGNSLQCRKKETRFERRRDGTPYARPHYDVIAESKAFRNGVLSILPQNVIKDFETRCIASGGASKEQTIDQLRAGVIAHAVKHAVEIDRREVFGLGYAEIVGLSAATKGGKDAFMESAKALGLLHDSEIESAAASGATRTKQPDWQPTEQEIAEIAAREQAEAQEPVPAQPARPRSRANSGSME